jgi:hypothetical protein
MSVKGSWSRVANRERYERNRQFIKMSTEDVIQAACDRVYLKPGRDKRPWVRTETIERLQVLCHTAAHHTILDDKGFRSLAFEMHKLLDEDEEEYERSEAIESNRS